MRTNKPILALVDDFLSDADIRDNSRKKYHDNMRIFVDWLMKNGDVTNPQRSDIIRYKQWLMDSGRKAQTTDNYLTTVRQFFCYLEEKGIWEDIAAGIRSPRMSHEYRKDHLKPDQVNRLLASVDRSTICGLRDFAIINLMVRTGMRCVEVRRLNMGDIRLEDDTWMVCIQGKGRMDKDRILGITPKVVEPMIDYFETRDNQAGSEPAFLNHAYVSRGTRITELTISKVVKRQLRRIGIDSKKISAHSLRHTAAVTALGAGASIYDVQRMLGHRDVKTTSIYLLSIAEEQGRKGTAVRLMDDVFKEPQKSQENGQITGYQKHH